MWFVTIVIRNNPLGWPSIASNWAKYSARNPFLPTGMIDGIFVPAWTYRVTNSIVVQPKRIGLKGWRYITCCRLHVFRCSQWDDVCVERFPSLFFLFSLSFSLSFFPILELTTSFFLSESFLFLKYKSMSWQCSCIMFFSIFFAKEGIIVFFSRKKSLSLVAFRSILSLVNWDRKCSFPWKRMKIVALFLHEENK